VEFDSPYLLQVFNEVRKEVIMRKAINIDEVRDFILAQTPETKIYIGGDSERFLIGKDWYADYIMVIVVHINGNNGCKIFGEVQRERDWDKKRDKPRMRLMNEVYKIAELYLKLHDVLEDREVQVHLDINPNEMHGSSCVINEAVGYIKGMCNVVPMVKPKAFAASYAADRYKSYMAA
jgi:predicted RNase H-related nuclease YkuK (DUF458 family)